MALRIRCVHCKKQFPFSRGMLGTRVTCPYCNRHFLCDSMPAEAGQATAAPAVPAEAAAPAPAPPRPVAASARPIAAAAVDRSDADAYDLRPEGPPAVAAPKRPVATPHKAPARPLNDSYDLKPDPAPAAKPQKPAAQRAVVAQAAPPPRKGLFARLFGRGT